MTNRYSPLHFAQIRIDRYEQESSVQRVIEDLTHKQGARVYFVNTHCVNTAQDDEGYRDSLIRAEYVFNDGAGIEMAGKALKRPMPCNLNGTDWIPGLLDSIERPHRIFLLGSRAEVLESAKDVFSKRWPHIEVVGTHHGFFNNDQEALEKIEESQPDILLSAMGVPRQELFIDQHWPELKKAGVCLGIAGGAVVDFLTQTVPRAPKWMQRARMEWVWRLAQEPGRMWRRYLIGNVRFLWILLRERFRSGA